MMAMRRRQSSNIIWLLIGDVLIGPIDEIGIEVSVDRDFLNKTTGIKQRESKTDSHENCCTDVSLSARKTLKVACHVKDREIFGWFLVKQLVFQLRTSDAAGRRIEDAKESLYI